MIQRRLPSWMMTFAALVSETLPDYLGAMSLTIAYFGEMSAPTQHPLTSSSHAKAITTAHTSTWPKLKTGPK